MQKPEIVMSKSVQVQKQDVNEERKQKERQLAELLNESK